ncbi:MAG: 30S ribosomal protein S11 [Berkelbacteria bacterium GW2011_GWA1_36_9]|uniref:Small ribosomal subunit protein uS11 n=1 Tax=Berkelbacteria bacterium GW2011_GWA1_36_9 TaxID=1618331 RepID=A0A0G0IQF1_9BACT|nr:MAG: 30S ribosomal protein S11 [Berkelbacteria bacterium GW2011_GWA1_36_9]
MAKQIKKKKTIRKVQKAIIFIQSSFNNSIITVTDDNGNVLSWASAGSAGFKGTKKTTPYAAQTAVRNALDKAKAYEISEAQVRISGVGSGREAAARALNGQGIKITQIKDITPIPHNGTRAKKARRI